MRNYENRRQLPPLGSLRAFEATARLGSTLAAADELCVTHGAISRQIKLLEAWLGLSLFDRHGKRLALTEQGRLYRDQMGDALDQIATATARLKESTRKTQRLTINALPTFAMRWLLPRLSLFQQSHPGIELRLVTSDNALEQLPPGLWSVAIRRESESLPRGYLAAAFLEEREIPVCAASLLAAHPINSTRDLAKHVLLHADTRAGAWARWLDAAGETGVESTEGLRFDHFYLALQAAMDGLGVALGPLPIIADDLASGRLVAPLDGPALPSRAYCWIIPEDMLHDEGVTAFCTWLEELGEDSA
ncbi:MAG: transcriptional regulator GcvA [Rhizobiales bacterium]|nr:transcriptional regulator GcvA [Hyphomicrobiales bacterium]